MSERFERIFTLTRNLYSSGAPVLVLAGALLKDTEDGNILAQLKLKSVSPKPIKAVKVRLSPKDTVGKALGEDIFADYLDLNIQRDAEFGQKQAIFIPNTSARSFSAEITEVAFSDNSVWTPSGNTWTALPELLQLDEVLRDRELVKQFRIHYGQKALFQPVKLDGLWLCTCGAINSTAEESCHVCNNKSCELFSYNVEGLKVEAAERLEKEAETKKKEAQKKKKIASVLIPVFLLCIAAFFLFTKVIIPNSKYKEASLLLSSGQYDEAIVAFESLNGYKDSAELLGEAKRAKEEQAQAEEERIKAEAAAQVEAENAAKYEEAGLLLAEGNYDAAIAAFSSLGDYRDSRQRAQEASEQKIRALYSDAENLEREGKLYEAALAFYGIRGYGDSWQRCFDIWGEITVRETLSAGPFGVVGLHKDGTIVIAGRSTGDRWKTCDSITISNWPDVVAVSAGSLHVVALSKDGTVYAYGDNEDGQCNVSNWTDIVAISAGDFHTVGLRADGTVVAVGRKDSADRCDVSDWNDIIVVAAGSSGTVGLCADGSVVRTGHSLNHEIDGWSDIIALASGDHEVGLRSNGKVITTRCDSQTGSDVGEWRDIIAVSAGYKHTVGLRNDGTVLSTGNNDCGQCSTTSWKNIVAISAGGWFTVGLRTDGSVAIVGHNKPNLNFDINELVKIVSTWTDIMVN